MIYQKDVICRGFTLCCGSSTKNETMDAPNIGDGRFNHYVYVYQSLDGVVGNGTKEIILTEGDLIDLSPLAGSPIKYRGGGMWVAINPFPDTKRYNGRLLKGPVTETIIGDGSEMFIIGLEKVFKCNGADVNPREYVRIFKDATKQIDIPEGAVAAVFTERK